MNNPAPLTQAQLAREDAASQAIDMLALYESMKDSMISFLRALHRANPKSVDANTILHMIVDIEMAIGAQMFGDSEYPSIVYEAIIDGSTEGAKEAIDDHFAGYLRQARAVANGEAL